MCLFFLLILILVMECDLIYDSIYARDVKKFTLSFLDYSGQSYCGCQHPSFAKTSSYGD